MSTPINNICFINETFKFLRENGGSNAAVRLYYICMIIVVVTYIVLTYVYPEYLSKNPWACCLVLFGSGLFLLYHVSFTDEIRRKKAVRGNIAQYL